MIFSYRKILLTGASMLACLPGASDAASSTTINFSATVTAVCSISAPGNVDLGEIPYSALSALAVRDELPAYSKTFTISTSCTGTNSYNLTFNGAVVNYGCLSGGNVAFCLDVVGNEDRRINLASSTERVVKAEGSSITIKATPMRLSSLAAGKGTGTMTVTISPL